MGLFDAAIGGLPIISQYEQFSAISKGAELQKQQLDLQEAQVQAQAAQKSIARSKALHATIASSRASEAAKGIGLSSPSFKAVQRTSFSNFDQDEKAAALNLSAKEGQISIARLESRAREKAQQRNVFSGLYSQAAELAFVLA